ncbi:DUF1573 domain-containing protein [Spongiivirga citrea]|uniref:DUF1573 domain-containing protein n=1 Tax=Spongiivirga citrea TaxID=1481457 RepID=A0A6M0CJ86_9FLAO|nr:DUF1573 domain-containing protein [Spongiivirga citrea]NER16054.1 DUF1573 domain-containing protein [Spongiivirga citrea]
MRKIALLSSVLLMTLVIGCKENATSKVKAENVEVAAQRDANTGVFPVMTFEETEWDFGEIESRAPQEHVFKFTNTGKAPLVIANINTTCGCTAPEWTREPVAPGATGEILVKFNGSGQNQVTKTLTANVNTESGKETFRIKAFVKPAAPTTAATAGK